MIDSLSQYVTLTVALVGLVLSVLTFVTNRRDMKKKLDTENVDSAIKNSKELQGMYETAFDEFDARWKTRLQEERDECEQKINRARQAIEEQARQQRGELLVKVEELEHRNQELKVQIAELGGVVQGATGLKIHQWEKKKA